MPPFTVASLATTINLAPGDAPDPRDYPRRWNASVVHTEGRQGREFEEGRAWIEKTIDPLARRQLTALSVPPLGLLPPTAPCLGGVLAQLVHERQEGFGVLLEGLALCIHEGS